MIEEQDSVFFTHNFKITPHNISKNDLEDMKILYKLYNVYYDIMTMDRVITDGCTTKAKTCYTLYNNHIQTCATEVKKNFCEALIKFKDVYNTLKSEQKFTDSQQTQEQVASEGSEPISSVPTELPPEKNKMIGFAGSILGSSTVLFSIYLVKIF
ncbi:variable surface protein Vir25, truncated, putative [Plasmodium vivax]|uniref:Variable surface protein Vir25, truncated, putative n=2 Tax=Plasmodium vivax TaxID=5855 RepID=A5KD76_PLAVS|nr:variable surface protein Vir25, truncated, putative [Plasmodium vivax]EDL42693.1 variable surface protein Vir25, truncated, putative [Plasmodium vivax]|eukprot:XP_001612486.1 variable surface protein Vir25, truncated [Plasmodium vivax Sal-1]